MSTTAVSHRATPKGTTAPAPRQGAGPSRDWTSPVYLHWAALGILVLLNLYFIAHLFVLWHRGTDANGAAIEQQRTQLRVATVAAQPLRGLDNKLSSATTKADAFYKDRLPQSYSEVLSELGGLARKTGVKLTGAQYTPATVLPNSPGQLTEVDIDARLSGEYRPLMLLLNSLERDKMFFIIRAVTFNGQQSGAVNLRLRLTTYLRGGPPPADDAAATASPTAPVASVPGGRP